MRSTGFRSITGFASVLVIAGVCLPGAARATPAPQASAQPADNTADMQAESARYGAAIRERVMAHWRMPPSLASGSTCPVELRQLPGGMVITATATAKCAFDETGKRSIEAAVLNAQPLPYRGFEHVFSRVLRLTFTAP